MQFTKNVDELVELFGSQKCSLTRYINKNLKEGVHYIEETNKLENTEDTILKTIF